MFAGRDLATLDEAALAQFRAEMLGFVFQSFNLIDDLTIEENVALGLTYRRPAWPMRVIRCWRPWIGGIAHRARHFPHQLSGGQQQRAAIARAIVGDPKLILADEPTGNLDTENGAQVMDILTGLNQAGATIVMVTHSPSHADLARRRIDMLDGRIVASAARAI
jgi:putative ABC transport system ATP-binding protein